MKKAKRGRPSADAGLQREEILKAAIEILDRAGAQGFSMRKVAEHLKVTPMALYNHFSSRAALLREISDTVYSHVLENSVNSAHSARENIEALLATYQKEVLRHPNLTLSIFGDPDAFSSEAERITEKILDLLSESELTASERKLWLNILVDFTHGSAIATAMNELGSDQLARSTKDFLKGLNKLLDCIF